MQRHQRRPAERNFPIEITGQSFGGRDPDSMRGLFVIRATHLSGRHLGNEKTGIETSFHQLGRDPVGPAGEPGYGKDPSSGNNALPQPVLGQPLA